MARNTSRFNKILNFIGLVDEQEDANQGYDQGRPSGAQTYNPSSRRAQQGGARPVRGQDYDDRPYGNAPRNDYASRYDSPPRYENPGRDYASSRDYGSPRDYAPQRDYARETRQSDYYRSQRADYDRVSSRPDYEPPRSAGRQQSDYRQASRADSARSDYYSQRAYSSRDYVEPQPAPEPRDNVVSLRGADSRAQTVIYYLHALEECRDVINDLLDNKTVLLNLEDMDERLIQRGIDTLCGAAFALNATLRKASDKTYLIAPNSVSVTPSPGSGRY